MTQARIDELKKVSKFSFDFCLWHTALLTGWRISEIAAMTKDSLVKSEEEHKGHDHNVYIASGLSKGGKRLSTIVIGDDLKHTLERAQLLCGGTQYIFVTDEALTKTKNDIKTFLQGKGTYFSGRIAAFNQKHFGAKYSAHDMRRLLADQNAPIDMIQSQMRHTDVNTTKRYISQKIMQKRIVNEASRTYSAFKMGTKMDTTTKSTHRPKKLGYFSEDEEIKVASKKKYGRKK